METNEESSILRITNWMRFWDEPRMTKSVVKSDNEFELEKGWRKRHMIWRRVSKSWGEWLKCFTVCVANDLKHSMTETHFDRRKLKTRVFWLLFCSQKSDRKISQYLEMTYWIRFCTLSASVPEFRMTEKILHHIDT